MAGEGEVNVSSHGDDAVQFNQLEGIKGAPHAGSGITTVTLGADGQPVGEVKEGQGDAVGVHVDPKDGEEAAEGEEKADTSQDGAEQGDTQGAEGDGEGDDKEDTSEAKLPTTYEEAAALAPELPEYDPSNAEVEAEYDKAFLTGEGEDAVLNTTALGYEVAAQMVANDGKPSLKEGTYKYLKKAYGISRETADLHIAGQVALVEKQQEAGEANVSKYLGDKATRQPKLDWLEANYTDEQKARWKAGLKEGGDAINEQMELLEQRFKAANPVNAPTPPVKRKPVVPARSTSKAAAAGGDKGKTAVPYATEKEHNTALSKAVGMKPGLARDKAIAETKARLLNSQWYKDKQAAEG